jgi:hypothetical protein
MVVGLAFLLGSCTGDRAASEAMGEELTAAAPDQVAGFEYLPGSWMDDPELKLYVTGDPTKDQLDALVCNLRPIIDRYPESNGLAIGLWRDRDKGDLLGEIHEFCES